MALWHKISARFGGIRANRIPAVSLKVRLGLGAAILGAGTVLTTLVFYQGLNTVASRLDTALASEARMTRYATLSQQASAFIVVATEAIQTERPPDIRADRIAPLFDQLTRTFEALRRDTEAAVVAAQNLGIDAQSRYGTQSLGIARMEALLKTTVTGLSQETGTQAALRAWIDSFASGFDPLLSQAVNAEIMFRNATLAGIADIRQRILRDAVLITGGVMLLVAWFYFGLVRPQFKRLDRLREAASQIGREDFDIDLAVTRDDEIGRLAVETSRAAAALSQRRTLVEADRARLNDTIAERTQALRQANRELEKIDANRRRFFADVSHELRTPLTVILMEAQIGLQAHPDIAPEFGTIEDRAARLNQRIDDLLRVARSDDGQLELDPQPVGLEALLTHVVAETETEIKAAGMELCTAPSPAAELLCDPNWMRQVLVGIVRNAVRHARAGGRIDLSTIVNVDNAEIAVTDYGPGIAPDVQKTVFERFSQGAGADRSQGFGIGLALAKWVVEAQGGEITVQSPLPQEDTKGTRLTIHVPLCPTEAAS